MGEETHKLEVAIGPNANEQDGVALPDGIIVSVTPYVIVPSGTLQDNGEIYANLRLNRDRSTNDESIRANLWAGYVSATEGATKNASSLPNLSVEVGQQAVVEAFSGSDVVVGTRVGFAIVIETDRERASGGGYIHWQFPGTGPGHIRILSLANPAAGAEYPQQTVPAGVRWKLRSFNGILTTGVAVANRSLELLPTFKGANSSRIFAGDVMVGSSTYYIGAARDLTPVSSTISRGFAFPDIWLTAGDTITFTTRNLQGADDYGTGNLFVEEWVYP